MKKLFYPLVLFFVSLLILESCEQREFKREKAVVTKEMNEIGVTGAIATGLIIDLGENGIVYEYGHCWGTSPLPTVENGFKTVQQNSNSTGEYISELTDLDAKTKYYIRAYVKSGSAFVYGEQLEFTTGEMLLATLLNVDAIDIGPTSIKMSCEINDIGEGSILITEYGHCWSSSSTAPTKEQNDGKTTYYDTNNSVEFTSLFLGLSTVSNYYVRAYATNEAGTVYSNTVNVTTLHPGESSGLIFVTVEGGQFNMGSAEFVNTIPIHDVNLSSYKISTVEVTNEMYADFINRYSHDQVLIGENIDKRMVRFSKEFDGKYWGVFKSTDEWVVGTSGFEKYPVVRVSWYGANEFCEFFGGRLPTEAEWEYAALGGNQSQNYQFSGSDNAAEVAWYGENIPMGSTHQTGNKKSNELGIFDMSGNVAEWCSDWYGEDYYDSSPLLNPQGPNGTEKIYRGGAWDNTENYIKIKRRGMSDPDAVYNSIGFRMVID